MGGTGRQQTLKAMWIKAAKLVSDASMITKVPGSSSEFCRMVASCTSDMPHFVSVPKEFTGQFLCDSRCPMYTAYKICAHTLATAENNRRLHDFLMWFCK